MNIRWDAHVCPPLKPNSDISFLNRYLKSGLNFISLNIGYDLHDLEDSINLANYFKEWIRQHSNNFLHVLNIDDLKQCKLEKKLGIAFDIEGSNIINEDINKIKVLHSLGVRQMSLAYNQNSKACGGCFGDKKRLSRFGKQLVRELNTTGITIDCSHVGYISTMDIIDTSEAPIIFSHSNPFTLVNHPRNVKDEQIFACAKRGGVIGITGVSLFLGDDEVKSTTIVEHIDYLVQKVGPLHVGIGMDCLFDEDLEQQKCNNPHLFPQQYGFNNVSIAKPEQILEIEHLLELKGYFEKDINNILGGNFFRIATLSWR